jgi:ribosomal protein S18 acetylase RimI-like enzyme
LTTATIRAVEREDIELIKQLATDNQMFGPEEVEFFDDTISGHLDGTLPDDRWFVAEIDGRLAGAAYVAPEPFGHLVWNLYFLATEPSGHGRGVGSQMIAAVEDHLKRLGARRALVLIVETSATDQYVGARRFYDARGFDCESTIRDFYGPGDAKVTYWKAMNR